MDKKILRATHEGKLNIGGVDLDVAVLEDGTRIITQAAVFKALDRPSRGNARVIGIPVFIDAKNLQPFITDELRAVINRIEYKNIGGKYQQGYDATILPLVSELYLKARRAGAIIQPNQMVTAQKAEILTVALSKVGMIALVDEATGYQHARENDELQKILKAYISEELLPWQKKFPDIYYQELFRLNGWDYTVSGIKKRPSCIGKWTNTIIYEQLPKDVLKTLKERTPKSESGNRIHRFRQLLTLDVGDPNLNAQIQQVLALFKISDTMEEFWQHFGKLKDRNSGQMHLPFKFDEKGHTIAPVEHKELSNFNKNIKIALNYNPNK